MKRIALPLLGLMLLAPSMPAAHAQPDSLLTHRGQRIFLSGMNLAWMNFANDLAHFDEELFTQQVEALAAAGGNTIRWWLHTNGRHSPQFTNGVVSGISPVEIANLERALDIAYERGVLLMLCLWSFDMLQPNALEANWPRNRALLEDPAMTQAYIDNALTPLVQALRGHPGIICWEIFNEPEGMIQGYGWTPQRVEFFYVQRFVNRVAGAIRRIDPDVMVSNGMWNIRVMSDIGAFHNYYRDDRLIAAGGDPLGTLDFYMVHYYTHFPLSESPFHHHASHWGLDKPIVIAEFSARGIQLGAHSLTPEQAYAFAFNNGYAGALAWTMTNHDGHGGLPDTRQAMLNLQALNPDVINVVIDPNFNFPPFVRDTIPPLLMPRPGADTTVSVADLAAVFGSRREGMPFTYEVLHNTNPQLVTPSITGSQLSLQLLANQSGLAIVTLRAIDSVGKSVTTGMVVSVYNPDSDDVLLHRRAFSSTAEAIAHEPHFAVDGDSNTRWSSEYTDSEWIAVELEAPRVLQWVMLHWEAAFGRDYEIQISADGAQWTTIYHEQGGNGGFDRILFSPVEASFIRLRGNRRATQWGYSLFAFSAYTTPAPNAPPAFVGRFADTVAHANAPYSAVVPWGLVADPDLGERIFFDVELAQAEGLPSWLTFDPLTRTLSGTPTAQDIGSYALVITATDMAGEWVQLPFTLRVEEALSAGATPVASQLHVFPNPVDRMLHISMPGLTVEGAARVTIFSATGRPLMSWQPGGLHAIDVSTLSPGVYIIQVEAGSNRWRQRFIKR